MDGSRVVVEDVGLNWTRTGFYRIAERMAAVIVGGLEEPGADSADEPVGELDVASGPLECTVVEPEEVPLAIDELTLVALLGAHAEGETVVRGAEELRLQGVGPDRGRGGGAARPGADIEATPDGFRVRGDGSPLRGGTIDAKGDHRMAMLGAVAGLASTEGVEVVGMDAAAVSYPGFERDLRAPVVAFPPPVYDTAALPPPDRSLPAAVTVVTYTAVALGAPATGRTLFVADRCWDVGGLGTLVLGIWLALNLDQYDFWDGWILGSDCPAVCGDRAGPEHAEAAGGRRHRRHCGDALAAHPDCARPPGAHGLEAGRMTVLGSIRPDDWDLPLFLHILGAMMLVGALVLGCSRGIRPQGRPRPRPAARLPGPAARRDPRWIVMRVGAQWTLRRRGSTTSMTRRPGWTSASSPPSPRSSC